MRQLRRLVTVSPAVEKSLSIAVDVAGTHKIDLATLNKWVNLSSFIFHHSKRFVFLDVKFKLTRLAQQSMQSVAVVKSPSKKKTKTAFDILLGKEDDDDPCDSCAAEISQYFAEKVVPNLSFKNFKLQNLGSRALASSGRA